jgi:ABC-type uncharacterized transport system auxiliary subunit
MLLFMSGCSIKDDPLPPKKNLRLADVAIKTVASIDKTLAVKMLDNVAYADTTQFVYTQEAGVYGSYFYHRWDERLSNQVKKILSKALFESKLYTNVVDIHSVAAYEYLLEITINRFEHNVVNGSKVDIGITLNLVDTNSKRSRSRTFDVTKDTQTVDATGALNAYNDAMRDLAAQMIDWLHRNGSI